jgi:sec-independent protein translocase protein TatC
MATATPPNDKAWKQKRLQEGANMEVVEHLDELRDRIVLALAGFIVALCVVGFPFNGPVMTLLMGPLTSLPEPASREFLRVLVGDDGSLALSPASRTKLDQVLPHPVAKLPEGVAAEPTRMPKPMISAEVEIVLPDGRSTLLGVDFRNQLFFFSPLEPFMLRLKIALLIGFIVALPFMFYQAWAFIAPGLLDHEQLFLRRILTLASILFPVGATFAYFFMTYALYFLFLYGGDWFVPAISVKAYFSFMLMMMAVMGIVFQCPLVVMGLVRFGIVPLDKLQRNRPMIVLAILVVSAVVTPPDPFTMMLMGVPLWILFEASLVMARIATAGSPARDAATASASE